MLLRNLTLSFIAHAILFPSLVFPQKHKSFGDHQTHPTAQVRQGTDFCAQELDALEVRKKIAAQALSVALKQSLQPNQVPNIALACSGGGCRAAIATLGLLRGLNEIGLLDAVTHAATVSGSTWTIGSWIYHDTNLDDLTAYLRTNLSSTFNLNNDDERAILESVVSKITAQRPFSANDIYSSLLANTFLATSANDGQNVYYADTASKVTDGRYPLPLFTAVMGQTSPDYQWGEFSPFECGSTYLNCWVPTSAFGRPFNNGVTMDQNPEDNFGYFLGMCGSAYAANVHDITDALMSSLEENYNINLSDAFCFPWFSSGSNDRLSPPQVNNFAYKLNGSSMNNSKLLTFVDAGMDINLPFPPLLRRNIPIIIVCDASSNALSISTNEMRKVQTYAQNHQYPLPALDYSKMTTEQVSIFADTTSSQAPIIIYIPNFQAFDTTKFSYTTEEFNRLMNGIEQAVILNKEQIYQAIALATTRSKHNPR